VEERLAEDPDFVPAFNHISLGDYLMRWQSSARKDAEALGLTPQSAAKILKDAEMGNLAAQTARLTQQDVEKASDSALEQARRLLLAGKDVIDV
jgi:phage gp29-like protein